MSNQDHSRKALSIHALLKDRAEATPEAVAIMAPGRDQLSYRRLFLLVEDTIDTLHRVGLDRNARIAIILPNGPEMAAAFLAVSACATSIPLNPAYRASEFDSLFAHLRVSALIVLAGRECPAVPIAKKYAIPVIQLAPRLDAAAGAFSLEASQTSPPARSLCATDDDTALILSTSGTTARPKIVPLTHANICTSAHNVARALQLTPDDRCLNVMPLFHIHGLIGALLSSLAAGGSVICGGGFHAPSIVKWLGEYRATWYTAVPTTHQAVLERASTNREALARCRLRVVRSCSAPLSVRVMAELEDTFQAPVIEAYGMTEAAHQITSNLLPPGHRKPGSVGVPVGTQVAVVSQTGRSLPPGELGEVVIRGPSVTVGYEGDAQANREAHIADWLRTGDQGYLDGDGYLFLTGRFKEMINRAGAKISPAEVDGILLDHPAVAEAVTFATPHPTLGEEVTAAVVLRRDAFATERDIREFSAGRLADFKVPSRVLLVEEIPKGPTGKLQRTGLAQRLGVATSGETPRPQPVAFVAPATELERTLAKMWSEVLGIKRIGVNDDFFEVGGDSLLGTELFLRVYQAMQVRLSLTQFFEIPTLAGQARAVGRSQRGIAPRFSVAIQSAGSRPPFFCVVAGTDITFLRNLGILLAPDQPFYALYPGNMAEVGIRYSPERAITEYVNEIRIVQPNGPYFLGGWCAGSGVALEVARRLMAQEHRVAMLALITPVLRSHFNRDIRSYWRSLSLLPPRKRLHRILSTLRGLREHLPEEIIRKRSAHPLGSRSPMEVSWNAQSANRAAFRRYARRTYPGRVSLFVTSDAISEVRPLLDPRVVLGKLATGGLDVYAIAGDHSSIVYDPHVKDLAKQLRHCLDQAMHNFAGT